jgi:hypothetical protein
MHLARERRRRWWKNRLVREFRRGIALLPFVGRRWAATSARISIGIRGPYGLGRTIERPGRVALPRYREVGVGSLTRGMRPSPDLNR